MTSTGTNPLSNARLHAFVEGRVQGVGFRAFVIDNAIRLHLTGWVRNTWNNEVEVLAEGLQQDLLTLLTMLREGPPSSIVTLIRQEWLSYTGEFSNFRVRFSE
jgi:acylphosphatase